jgi:hypothetical protein
MFSRLRSGIGTRISFFAFHDIITSVTGILILITLILSLYLNSTLPVSAEQEQQKQKLSATLEDLRRVSVETELRQTNLTLLATAPSAGRLQAEIGELEGRLAGQSNRLAALRQSASEEQRKADFRAEKLGLSGERERAGRIQQEIAELRETNNVEVAEALKLQEQQQRLQTAIQQVQSEHRLWLLPETGNFGKKPVLVTVSGTKLTSERFSEPASRKEFPAATARQGLEQGLAQWHRDRDYIVFYVRPSGIDAFIELSDVVRLAGFQIGFDAVEEDRQIIFSAPTAP